MSDEKSATPGPWLIKEADVGDEFRCIVPIEIRSGQNNFPVVAYEGGLAAAEGNWTTEELWANARLIAASPDLLAALEACVGNPYFSHWRISEGICEPDCPRCKAEAAIKAAKG